MRRSVSAFIILCLAAAYCAAPAQAAPQFTATLAATPAAYVGPCPALIHLDGKIVNAPDYVASTKYSLLNSDGIDSFLMTATFNAAHTYDVHDARTPGASGVYWVQILVRNPSGADIIARSNKAAFTVRCTSVKQPPPPCPPGKVCTPNPNATPTPCPPTIACPPNPKVTPTPCHPTAATNIPCIPTPKPTATPCHPNTAGPPVNCLPTPMPRATPCHDAAGRIVPCKDLPDLTARPPVRIGNPAHAPIPATTWGLGLTLTDADAVVHSNGRCAFDIWYTYVNIGTALAAPPFKNVIKVDGLPVSIQGPLALLPAGASKLVMTQAYLPGGVHHLTLAIDDPNVVIESNELNNHFEIKYQLTGNCSD